MDDMKTVFPFQAVPEEDEIIIKKTENINKYFELAPQKLGQGRFGITRVATDRQTNIQYACKTVHKSKLKNESEVEMLQKGAIVSVKNPCMRR